MRSLHNATHHVDEKAQRQMNMMGDCFSSQVAREILETVCEDEDEEILSHKTSVESLFTGPMAGASERSRRNKAHREGITGFTFLPDNVGFVRPSKYIPCTWYLVKTSIWLGKLDGVGPVDNRPSTNKLHHFVPPKNNFKKTDIQHVTCDTLHVTRDT